MTTKRDALHGYFKLTHNVRLYIPSTLDVNKRVDTAKYVREVLAAFSGFFGGATSYQASGAWVSTDKGLVTEPVTIVESYATTKAINQNLSGVVKLATKIKTDLKQEAVSVEKDHQLFFI